MDLPKNPLGLESHVIKDANIMSPDFHTEGQITCNPFLARLNTDNCWIAKEKVNSTFIEYTCVEVMVPSAHTLTVDFCFGHTKFYFNELLLAKRQIIYHNQSGIASRNPAHRKVRKKY